MFTGQDAYVHDTYYVVFHGRALIITAVIVALLLLARWILSRFWPGAFASNQLSDLQPHARSLQHRLMGRDMVLVLAGTVLILNSGSLTTAIIFITGMIIAIIDGLVVMFSESPEASIRYWIYAAAMLGVVMLVLT